MNIHTEVAKFAAAWEKQEGYKPAPFQKAIAMQRLARGQTIAEIIAALTAQRVTFECERPARNMIVQAITTRYLGPTNTRGGRIKAKAWAKSLTVEYDHALNVEDNHREAAEALIAKLDWAKVGGVWHQGGHPDGSGYCFVCVSD
jgi:hypothetical protein